MPSAILGILKVIGILLLILLGILLLLILLVLFHPIFYKISGHKEPEEYSLEASAHWLFGLVGVRFLYPNPGTLTVRLLWLKIFDSSKATKKKKVSDTEQDASAKDTNSVPEVSVKTSTETNNEATGTTGNEVETKSETKPATEVTTEATTKATTETTTETTTEATPEEPKKPFPENIKASIEGIIDKIKHLYKEACFYKKFWEAKETQAILKKVWNKLKKILLSILPKHLEADVLLGTGQPDTTGYVMAIYGILIPYLGPKVNITPDFEEQIIQGRFKAKGHLSVFTILKNVLSVLLDKNLRIVYRRFQRHKEKQQAKSAA